ncbi:helix-turn-helix domain-containing protein [Candidatus Leptofilum sp.]|uniref:helix-turn-helix domain-containing protein n=1 Tax=Candidatus Leptofilum sp. TaxID=3241576 RepID=UPI003B5ABFDA
MDPKKKEKLVQAGWAVGSAEDFLELSPEEAAYIELKLALAENLRQVRQNNHLTQKELARLIKSSQSRVAKMESGDPSVSIDLLIRSLFALGKTLHDLSLILAGR